MAKQQQRESSNVFEQLGFKREEALNLRLRSEMMNALIAEIEKRGLTQAQAAAQLGEASPRRKPRRNWASLNHVSPISCGASCTYSRSIRWSPCSPPQACGSR